MFKKTDLRALFHVEAALIYSSFYFVEKAEGHVAKAAAAAGMKLSETGAMGRRTKFQGSFLNASLESMDYFPRYHEKYPFSFYWYKKTHCFIQR